MCNANVFMFAVLCSAAWYKLATYNLYHLVSFRLLEKFVNRVAGMFGFRTLTDAFLKSSAITRLLLLLLLIYMCEERNIIIPCSPIRSWSWRREKKCNVLVIFSSLLIHIQRNKQFYSEVLKYNFQYVCTWRSVEGDIKAVQLCST